MVGNRIDCNIPASHQARKHFCRIEQYLARFVLIQTRGNLIEFSETVTLIDNLIAEQFFYTHIAHINIRYIIDLLGQIVYLVLFLFLNHAQPVTHITNDQTEDQKLCDPDISIVVQHHIKSASVIHLAETITAYSKQR